MTCVFGFAEPKTLESSPRHLSSLICRWLHPLPHVWSMTLVCLLFSGSLKAICSSSKMEPSSLSLVYTDVNKAPYSLGLREHVFPEPSEKRHFIFSPPQLFPSSFIPCSLPEPYFLPVQDQRSDYLASWVELGSSTGLHISKT